MIKTSRFWAAFFAVMLLSSFNAPLEAGVTDVLNNGSFEDGIGGSGNWDNTPNRGITLEPGGVEGKQFLRLDEGILAGGAAGAFTFQTATKKAKEGDRVAMRGYVRLNSLDGGEEAQIRIEYQTSAGGFISSQEVGVSAVTPNFQLLQLSGIAPAGTGQVTFVLRIQPSNVGGTAQADFDGVEGSISSTPIHLNAAASRNSAAAGDIIMVSAKVQNTLADALDAIKVIAEPQAGLNIDRRTATLNGNTIATEQGSVIFVLGTLQAGEEAVLAFPVILSSSIVPGKSYSIQLRATASDSLQSVPITLLIRTEADPVFDEGTIIGKVFNDINQNTVQDPGEKGVPWVKLVTEEGIIVITDEEGRYSIPGVSPGRHLVKIDGHSLPEGTKFITEETFLVKTTQGLMNKANFAVLLPPSDIPKNFQDELDIRFSQGLDTSRPSLKVEMKNTLLKTGLGSLESPAVFTFDLNYADFIKTWYLEIRDELGQPVWIGFGVSSPPAEVTWTGETDEGTFVKPGIYSYQLKVEDHNQNQDWTPLGFFRVVNKGTSEAELSKMVEIPAVGDFNIFEDGKNSIPLIAKPTVRIEGKTKPGYQVKVNGYPIEVNERTGRFRKEFYVNPGDKEYLVEATSPEGVTTRYSKTVSVKDSQFFMVALGEEEMGFHFGHGNLDSAGKDEAYREGFYEDGRLSYFLRGKIKGKFLIQSHYDTGDKRSAVFRNLDPDDYYPVYGDDSQINYDALNTEQRFYFLIEMDRSYLKWGSYETGFNQTELATYNRALSGLKIHHETLGTTPYGDPKKGFDLFWSDESHKADHNELAATGGSLYYVRNRNVVEGSERVRVEIRDKIQDITIRSYDLTEGADYSIDYREGRILLNRPLSSIAASDTLVTADILDGSPVFLVVDYEYEAGFNAIETSNRGLRGYTNMGDHIRVGGTYVQEERNQGHGQDYQMIGLDVQMKVGRNTKITAEYAESKKQQTGQAVSYDGGLTYRSLSSIKGQNTRPRENAYLIRAESKPIKNMEVSGFIQAVEPGFSNDHSRSQEGYKKYGIDAKYRFTDHLYARYRFDSAEVIGQLLPLVNNGIEAEFETKRSHTAQLVYDDGKWLGQAEVVHQVADLPVENRIPSLLSESPYNNALAAKLGYRIDERLLPYLRFQTAIKGETNYQLGGGLRYQIAESMFAYMEQMFGNIGDSQMLGFEKIGKDGVRSYANIRARDQGIGTKTLSSSVGSSWSLTEHSRMFTEREVSTHDGVHGYGDIVGYQGRLSDPWDYELRYERRHLGNGSFRLLDNVATENLTRTNTFNTVSGAIAYNDGVRLKFRTHLEVRRDQDAPKLWQWVSRNQAEYKINEDLRYLGKLDFGKSRFTSPGDNVADFVELNAGFAYRPVDNDRLNMLGRYAYQRNLGNDAQFDNELFLGIESDEVAHILSMELSYDINKYLTLTEKVAFKTATLDTSVTDNITLNSFLWVNRFNFHVTKKWDLALEYRILMQQDANSSVKQGALIEVDREFYDYVRLGLGYNFTDFDDDLESNDFDSGGPFVRMTGKF